MLQICPGFNAYEMHVLKDRDQRVSSSIIVHQNTPNSVKYEVIWKCKITQSNMKYLIPHDSTDRAQRGPHRKDKGPIFSHYYMAESSSGQDEANPDVF